jgi:uncharacterized protein (DUF934 family)
MSNIIKLVAGIPAIVADDRLLIREIDPASMEAVEQAIVPFSYFQTLKEDQMRRIRAVWISPEDDFEPFVPHLLGLEVIAVDFPVFRDGRGYSVATLLRSRYGWKGELRAIGDVLRDQLNYMRRCGFDAFAIRADKNIHDAIKSFTHYTVRYQGAVDDPVPLFRRRNTQPAS